MFGSRLAYTACTLVAVILAGWWIRRRQRGWPLDRGRRWGIAIGGLLGATLAAKAPFVVGQSTPEQLFAAWLGDGKTILWGLAGGYLGVELAKWSLRIRGTTGDSFVVPVAAAVAVGRIGCLLYGCCYGLPTDQTWGIRSAAAPDGGALLRHPTQVYEFAFHIGFAAIAWAAIGRGLGRGAWMPGYIACYGAFRFASEFWRAESPWLGGWTFYQWSALLIGLPFLGITLFRRFSPIASTAPIAVTEMDAGVNDGKDWPGNKCLP